MIKYCDVCEIEHSCDEKKCPACGKKLDKKYSEEELDEIKKQNDDFTVINTFLM